MLDASLDAIAARPPRLSYDVLADLAAVNKTTLYRNWPDPADLVIEALDTDAGPPPLEPGSDLRSRLRDLAADARRWFETERNRLVVTTTLAMAQHDSRVAAAFDRYWSRRFARLGTDDPAARRAADTLAAQTMFHALVRRRAITDADIETWVEVAMSTLD
ncbi:hypothetical protein C1N91_07830 [Curtobacterium sp. SGAir0471]|nr:hypothetical protein C1N91_07830 [Curtobacterium sp. SGAir0471]